MTDAKDKYDVIVVGAGVVGPCIATALARQGRKVLIVERDWSKPDRIVGELMQPAGLKALRELGMIEAVNDIEAIYVKGYHIKLYEEEVIIEYPEKQEANRTNAVKPVPGCVYEGNDKLHNDATIKTADWDTDERVRGIAFHHGDFLTNLRSIVRAEPNVTSVEGTVTAMVRDQLNEDIVTGVKVKQGDDVVQYDAKLTICCDGIYSKFRRELSADHVPTVGSYFVGLELEDAVLPSPHHGHVILGAHAPVLIYQISPHKTRILCAHRSTRAPSQAKDALYNYLRTTVLPALPEVTRPAFAEAIEARKFRSMPNQFLSAVKQGQSKNFGLVMLGDSLNMRHPLTGGGMTVGINDAALLAKLLHPKQIEDLEDYQLLATKLSQFHTKRKNLDAVINTLSIALYALFAADSRAYVILQKGCFKYFQRGGACVSGPIGLLSGMLPFPMLLFNHFFSVAFYAIYCNFIERGVVGIPVAIYESFEALITAAFVITPYLYGELT